MKKEFKYKVCIKCFTYNHAPFIVDTMNGFTRQKSDFPMVYCIVDDASSDGEQDVIRQYLAENFGTPYRSCSNEDYDLICANHKDNVNCYFVVFLLRYNHYRIKKPKVYYLSEWIDDAKYIALCEGDDFWTESYKLQKQVDFMDSHSDYSLCFHNAIVDRSTQEKNNSLFADIETRDYSAEEISVKWLMPTASLLFTKDSNALYQSHMSNNNGKIVYADSFLKACCIHLGRIYGFSDVMSVYRKHPGGMVFKRSIEQKRRFCTQLLYTANAFPEQKEILALPLSNAYLDLSLSLYSEKKYLSSIRCYFKSFFASPSTFINDNLNILRRKVGF